VQVHGSPPPVRWLSAVEHDLPADRFRDPGRGSADLACSSASG
jgi:hypothetical protein